MTNEEKFNDLESIRYLDNLKIDYKKIILESAPHTAQDVVDACECPIEEVLKTLVFIGDKSPVIAVVAGNDRVDSKKLGNISKQEALRMAKPEEVFELTSCKVGTVSPFISLNGGFKIMDAKVLKLARTVSGSGQGSLLLSLENNSLEKVWDGKIADIT